MWLFGKQEELPAEKIYHVDPKIRVLWGANGIVLALVVWFLLTLTAYYAFPKGIYGISRFLYPVVFFFLVGLFLIPYLIWIELRYRTYYYYFTKGEVVIRRGILHVEKVVIPFNKIQNVNVSRSLVERLLGLATVRIETAGSLSHNEATIEGMSNFAQFINEVLQRVEETKVEEGKLSAQPRCAPEEKREKDEEGERQQAVTHEVSELKEAILALKAGILSLEKEMRTFNHHLSQKIAEIEQRLEKIEGEKVEQKPGETQKNQETKEESAENKKTVKKTSSRKKRKKKA